MFSRIIRNILTFITIFIFIFFYLFIDSSDSTTFIERITGHDDLVEILKGRYNYASADCAARILATNRGAKGAASILQSNRDSYLLNLCQYNDKHVVIELCQDIRIDMLVIATFEYFSSAVHSFRVSVSKKYPPIPQTGGWRLVGIFEAENSKREQIFIVHGMTMYARYVRVDFDTHYGHEYYCLLSSLRVFGKTMMEDFEEEKEATAAVGGNVEPAGELPIKESNPPTDHSLSVVDPKANITTGASIPFIIPAETSPTATTVINDLIELTDKVDTREPVESANEFCHINSLELFSLNYPTTSAIITITATATTVTAETRPVYERFDLSHGTERHENIFKSLHDRIFKLERNFTLSKRSIEGKLAQVVNELQLMKEEIGITNTTLTTNTTDGKGQTGQNNPTNNTSKLLNYLERSGDIWLEKLRDQVKTLLKNTRDTDRMLWWLGIFCALQINTLLVILLLGYCCGWFNYPVKHRSGHPLQPSTSNSVINDDESKSLIRADLPLSQSMGMDKIFNDGDQLSRIKQERVIDDQRVPPGGLENDGLISIGSMKSIDGARRVASSSSIIHSPGDYNDSIRSNSSSTIGVGTGSDFVMNTAGRPLLLDESEADIIEATFVPSPLSSPLYRQNHHLKEGFSHNVGHDDAIVDGVNQGLNNTDDDINVDVGVRDLMTDSLVSGDLTDNHLITGDSINNLTTKRDLTTNNPSTERDLTTDNLIDINKDDTG